jgi:hypothetical protein
MDQATLLQKIKNDDLTPKGRPGTQRAREAIQQLELLEKVTDLDPKAKSAARKELLDVIREYRRIMRVKRMGRRKRTRG